MSSKADKNKLDAEAEKLRQLRKQSAGEPRHQLEPIEIHSLAKLVPEMSPERYEEFVADVKAHGLTDPIITLYEGKILDGRHRDRACRELGITRTLKTYDGTDPAGYVISKNIMRRDLHLTDDQRVALITKIRAPQLEAEAKERQLSGLRKGDKTPVSPKSDERDISPKSDEPRRVDDQIAREAKVTRHKARQAIEVDKAGLSDEVITGTKSLKQAAREIEAEKPKGKQQKGTPRNGEDAREREQFEDDVSKAFKKLVAKFGKNREYDVKLRLFKNWFGIYDRTKKDWATPKAVTYEDDSTFEVEQVLDERERVKLRLQSDKTKKLEPVQSHDVTGAFGHAPEQKGGAQ